MDNSVNHSFGVIAYKDSPYLKACLDSLKRQTVKSHIYITTSTPSPYIEKIASEYCVQVFITKTGRGIANDWNFCLGQASTRYVTLAHQDDVYLPRYTEQFLKAVTRYEDLLICFSDYEELKDGQIRKGTLLLNIKSLILNFFMPFRKSITTGFLKRGLISFGNPIAAPCVMYDLKNLRGFHFSDEFRANLDWDAWYRMSMMKGRFLYIRKTLMYHRIHKESETSRALENEARKIEDRIMYRKFWPAFIANFLAEKYKRSYQSND